MIATDALVAGAGSAAAVGSVGPEAARRVAAAGGAHQPVISKSLPPPGRTLPRRDPGAAGRPRHIDALYLPDFVTPSFTDTQAIAREIVAAAKKRSKPIVCNLMTDLTQERACVGRPATACPAMPTRARPREPSPRSIHS
ncbi:MAG: hypothetical protein IPG91_19710 [Ideonella sp.]|nr:hypothetical protein [Ideonella sp.]